MNHAICSVWQQETHTSAKQGSNNMLPPGLAESWLRVGTVAVSRWHDDVIAKPVPLWLHSPLPRPLKASLLLFTPYLSVGALPFNGSVADFNLDYSFHLQTEQRPCAPSPSLLSENTITSLKSLSRTGNKANLFIGSGSARCNLLH